MYLLCAISCLGRRQVTEVRFTHDSHGSLITAHEMKHIVTCNTFVVILVSSQHSPGPSERKNCIIDLRGLIEKKNRTVQRPKVGDRTRDGVVKSTKIFVTRGNSRWKLTDSPSETVQRATTTVYTARNGRV